LHERAATQSHDPGSTALQFVQNLAQGAVFSLTERRFSGIPEDFLDFAAFPPLDAVVKVFKEPVQPLPKGPAYGTFSGAHESDQKNDLVQRGGRLLRHFNRHTATLPGLLAGRALRASRFSFRRYFALLERFLRWILPLKVRSTTVEETEARPMVPAKALPSL